MRYLNMTPFSRPRKWKAWKSDIIDKTIFYATMTIRSHKQNVSSLRSNPEPILGSARSSAAHNY